MFLGHILFVHFKLSFEKKIKFQDNFAILDKYRNVFTLCMTADSICDTGVFTNQSLDTDSAGGNPR